jgi:TRAP-type C4-dicarboxylate transport system permease large subunit
LVVYGNVTQMSIQISLVVPGVVLTGLFVLPLAQATGMSAIRFSIVMCVNPCIGLLTPPVGLNLLLGTRRRYALIKDFNRYNWGVFFK